MKHLLDTMVWLWSVGPTENIGSAGLRVLQRDGEDVYLSQRVRGKSPSKPNSANSSYQNRPGWYLRSRLSQQGIRPPSITLDHSVAVHDLPLHHNDPFDRMIIAQAILEKMTVMTSDRIFKKYPVDILWCGT